ncbi:AMP-binding protein [Streptomyces sp. NPDC051704]|uniref:AMP-binding protein n=1 Tax=Streptomyces sp. NPDC051704 TaxID=3365671 RepID=UPI00379C1471
MAVEPDTAPDTGVTPDHLAYVIYTSGSTGLPKGTLVPHANVTRLFSATDHWFGFGPDDVWTLFHSIAFDFSVWELWGALAHGGRLVVVPYGTSRSPEEFHRLRRAERVGDGVVEAGGVELLREPDAVLWRGQGQRPAVVSGHAVVSLLSRIGRSTTT